MEARHCVASATQSCARVRVRQRDTSTNETVIRVSCESLNIQELGINR